MATRNRTRAQLSIERLEGREVPAGFTESFDSTPPRLLPDRWESYANTDGAQFQTSSAFSLGAGNGLASFASGSTATARVWNNNFTATNVQASTAVKLDSLVPAQLFVRGSNLNSDSPTFYAVSVTRGMQVQLLRVVNGQSTVLATVNSEAYESGAWIRVTLVARGDELEVRIFRTDKAQFLTSKGKWQAAAVSTITVRDSAIRTAGAVGLNRPASVAGTVSYDNVMATDTLPNDAVIPISEEDFRGTAPGQLPSGWSQFNQGSGSAQVTNSGSLIGNNGLAVGGGSDGISRAWLNSIVPADARISAAVYLDSLVPAELFARGRNLSSNAPTYYAVRLTRGLDVQLLRVVDGQATVLRSLKSASYFSGEWVQTTFTLQGSQLTVQIYRTDTAEYLSADGSWSKTETNAVTVTDSLITGEGRVGVGRSANVAGNVRFDNFAVSTFGTPVSPPASGGTTSGGTTSGGTTSGGTTSGGTTSGGQPSSGSSNASLRQNFDNSGLGTLPTGWSQWSNNLRAGFYVSSLAGLSKPHGLVATGNSDMASRAWLNTVMPADVQVSASVFLDALSPGQVIARGRNLTGNTPTYYAASVTRGLEVQLVKVVNGQTTVLGTLNSAEWLSNQWVQVTLAVTGTTIQAMIYRIDTRQYLNGQGRWQSTATACLEVSDAAIAGGGSVGLARPARYNGRVLFDDFAAAASSSKLPSPSTTTPGSNPTLPTNPGPNSGTNGQRPAAPRHFAHIRIAQLAYSGNPMSSFEQNLLRTAVDLVIPNASFLSRINSIAPNTPQLIYGNAGNFYSDMVMDWLNWADRNGVSREAAFYHTNKAMPFTGASAASRPVTWFWGVYRGAGSQWSNVTSVSRSSASGFALGAAGESLAIGSIEKFREINIEVRTPASGGWAGVLEYASAVDTNGNPTAWRTLRTLSDGTAGFTRTGRVTFDPPADWRTASIGGSERLFYVRVRTTSSGGTAPVLNTVLGRDYVNARGAGNGTIPAWDASADKDGDGYLNDAEYANRTPGKDARFLYESRVFYPYYGQHRYAGNVSDPNYRRWIADYHFRYLQANPLAAGVFMDNSRGKSPFAEGDVIESVANYTADHARMLGEINKRIGPKWVIANAAAGGDGVDQIAAQGVSTMEEFAIRPTSHNYSQLEHLAETVARRSQLNDGRAYIILDSFPSDSDVNDPRYQIGTLAYYYLMADSQETFLMINGGYEPSTSWTRHWFDAIKYDVGQPAEDMALFASGQDPSNRNLNYRVYQREFDNALVLFKPLSYTPGRGTGTTADATATTHHLSGTYRLLRADGTLGPAVNRVTLRNGEGAILVKV